MAIVHHHADDGVLHAQEVCDMCTALVERVELAEMRMAALIEEYAIFTEAVWYHFDSLIEEVEEEAEETAGEEETTEEVEEV